MPEIKNVFHKGIMNKDLDERLVPDGQYRDAMNIQVSTSEGADIGTVQNILGNIRVDGLNLIDFKCVGAVADEKNDVLYWFVTSFGVDAIIEYNNDGAVTPILVDTNDVLKFNPDNIITGINIIDNLLFWTDDVNEPRKINIDTFKLNGHTNLSTHSNMFVNELIVGPVTEDHITVIRKRPNKAPTVIFSESTYTSQYVFPDLNLYIIDDPATGLGSSAVVGSPINYTWDYFSQNASFPNTYPPYAVGEEFVLSLDSEPGSLPYNYQVKLEVISVNQPPNIPIPIDWDNDPNTPNAVVETFYVFEVIEIDQTYQNEPLTFNATQIVETKPIFEKELIRFATRWKYADGEYSAFSPFTVPIFLAGQFYFHPTDDPFNQGMESKAISITLQDLIPFDTPDDVVQLDILFKKERSTTIYSIDSIKPGDVAPADHWNEKTFASIPFLDTNYPHAGDPNYLTYSWIYDSSGEYKITTENIYAALPDNQMLRPWDNVPRKALAQEITANRVVYGNYLQNYNLKDYTNLVATPWIVVGEEDRKVLDEPVTFVNNRGKKSIKSLRTYYLGVVYGDKYGRETPVLTSKDASIHIPFDFDDTAGFDSAADKSLRLTAKLSEADKPEWAYYYKYFIKQTTGEYYNLTMDRVYKAAGDSNLWISFPSSDRNKIEEGDYFSIKKQVDIEAIIPVENKIKIIDIKNEAPESIKYEYTSLGSGGGGETVLGNLFPDPSAHPAEGVKRLLVDKDTWVNTENGLALEDLSKSERLAVQFTIIESGNTIKSEKYFVSGFTVEDSGEEGRYNLVLRKTIEPQDGWVESSPGVLNFTSTLTITIYKLEEKSSVEFEGRFFVKIVSNPVTQTYLVPSAQDLYNIQILGTLPMFRLADRVSTFNSGFDGIYNRINNWSGSANYPTTSVGLSNTEDDWDGNTTFGTGESSSGGWFLDYAGFVAAQKNANGIGHIGKVNAERSGKMYKGNPMQWTSWPTAITAGKNQYINGLEGIIAPTLSTGSGQATAQSYIDGGPYGQSQTSPHPPQGSRHWSSEVINLDSDYTASGSPNPHYSGSTWIYPDADFTESPYIPVEGGGFWMHLSYACPGEDLHDGDFDDFKDDVNLWDLPGLPTFFIYKSLFYNSFQGIRARAMFLNGVAGDINNDWTFKKPPGWEDGYDNLDDDQKEAAENQWTPGWDDAAAGSIVKQLEPGSRFKIIGDTDANKTYTILRVDERRLYNHTAFNPSPTINNLGNIQAYGSGGGAPNESVAYHVQTFFDAITSGSSIITNPATAEATLFDNMTNAIHNFGKANNRRTCYILQLDGDPRDSIINATTAPSGANTSFPDTANKDISQIIRFVDDYIEPGFNTLPVSPAVFETEAKEDVDLNVYYEASDALPVGLDDDPTSVKGHLLGPIGYKVTCTVPNSLVDYSDFLSDDIFLRVKGWEGNIVELNSPGLKVIGSSTLQAQTLVYEGKLLKFWREDGSYATAQINEVVEISGSGLYVTKLKLHPKNFRWKVGLPYYNSFSFGNGVESNRVRDDFNESFILNGVKASTVLEEPYEEERRKYGLIYSGIYNTISGINNLNQFIQAEKITKDLMPSYGSIQKLYARDKDLITLCEDKIIRVYVDKDILYNADGNTQLLATNRVLGTAEPFRGNFGISKNPESFAAESFRAYFTDKQRGAVIRLSMDGITPISDAGMHDYFRDSLPSSKKLLGSYDAHKENYNLTMIWQETEQPSRPSGTPDASTIGCTDTHALNFDPLAGTSCEGCCVYPEKGRTISFNEMSKGWVSFKSFVPEFAISSVNQYYTMNDGELWKHHQETTPETRNTFYEDIGDPPRSGFTESSITPILNKQPDIIKNFNTLNYEGSQTKVDEFTTITANGVSWTDGEYYNLQEKDGWYVKEIYTDKQDGTLNEFIEKEGKWFNYIKGKTPVIDTAAFNFQGLGIINNITRPPGEGSWDCTKEGCLDPGDGSGAYSTFAACWTACAPPEPCESCDDSNNTFPGCCDPTASNYSDQATCDDGSCIYCIYGCTDPLATNYDASATCDDGSCIPIVYGCIDPLALNYYAGATVDDGSCIYPSWNCINRNCVDPLDGSGQYSDLDNCEAECDSNIYGCTHEYGPYGHVSTATNYNPLATVDDGSCCFVNGHSVYWQYYWNPANIASGPNIYAYFNPVGGNYLPGYSLSETLPWTVVLADPNGNNVSSFTFNSSNIANYSHTNQSSVDPWDWANSFVFYDLTVNGTYTLTITNGAGCVDTVEFDQPF